MTENATTTLADVNFAHGKVYIALHKFNLHTTPAEILKVAEEVKELAWEFHRLARHLEEGI